MSRNRKVLLVEDEPRQCSYSTKTKVVGRVGCHVAELWTSSDGANKKYDEEANLDRRAHV